MAHEFLSEDWFAAVEALRAEMGGIEVSGAAKDIVININIHEAPSGTVQMHMAGGAMERGHAEAAPTTINLPYDLAFAMFIAGDQSAGMNGFMAGKIKIDGDMSKIMAMQGAQADGAAELQKKIAEITAPLG